MNAPITYPVYCVMIMLRGDIQVFRMVQEPSIKIKHFATLIVRLRSGEDTRNLFLKDRFGLATADLRTLGEAELLVDRMGVV